MIHGKKIFKQYRQQIAQFRNDAAIDAEREEVLYFGRKQSEASGVLQDCENIWRIIVMVIIL